jgi:hypothetical protein
MIHISFAACMVSASRRLALDVKALAIRAILRSALLEGLITFCAANLLARERFGVSDGGTVDDRQLSALRGLH